jgi:DNA-directed RNA polymerase subunit RPC12/RpoP
MSSKGMALGTPAVNMAGTTVADAGLHCDECGSDEVYRIFRRGYLQEKIYPLLGFYPWRCKRCGMRLITRERGTVEQAELHGTNRIWRKLRNFWPGRARWRSVPRGAA